MSKWRENDDNCQNLRVKPADIAEKIAEIFKQSTISHDSVLYTDESGQQKFKGNRINLPDPVINACDFLIEQNKHPALQLGSRRYSPFDLFDYKQDYENDPQVRALFDSLLSFGFREVFFCPLRDSCARVYVVSACRRNDVVSLAEVRLLHALAQETIDEYFNFTIETLPGSNVLTGRERECLIAAAAGDTEKETARRLGISPNTVHRHLESAKKKFNARNKMHTIVRGLQNRELQLHELLAAA